MATKLARVTQKVFGSAAGATDIGVFGSYAAGSPAYTTDPSPSTGGVQSLANFLTGLFGASVGGAAPCEQDLNALFFLAFRQIAYIMQTGVPEYDAATSYFTGSIVTGIGTGQQFVSLVDNNLANALSNSAYWKVLGGGVKTITATTYTVLQTDDYVRLNTASNAITATLPLASATPTGKRFTFKNVASISAGNGNVTAAGSDTIDGQASIALTNLALDSITIINNGTSWDII